MKGKQVIDRVNLFFEEKLKVHATQDIHATQNIHANTDIQHATSQTPNKISDEVKSVVISFYNRDSISRQMPGIRDWKSV